MIREEIVDLVKKAVKKTTGEEIAVVEVGCPENSLYGDYSTNVAFSLAKILKKNPIEIAQSLSSQLSEEDLFEKAEAISPGFVNFFISEKRLFVGLNEVLKEKDRYGSSKKGKGKTVVIDYSAPNIAKPFGIGHLRSTIIGQAVYNIYQFLGWKCIGDNHLGDWGTQYGKLVYQLKKNKFEGKTAQEKKEILKNIDIAELEKLYVAFHKEAENNPEMEERARECFKQLEQGDAEAKELWQACVDVSLREFDKIYNLLGVKIDYALGESFYQNKMAVIVEELRQKGIVSQSQGALIIECPQKGMPPSMVLKSDGATTYLTRDLATIKYRLKQWKPDLIIYEVGADQSFYFKQLFAAVEMLEWMEKDRLVHMSHGLIRWQHGKFSTRRGDTIHLEEILEDSIKRAAAIMEGSESNKGLSETERSDIAKMVGIGAIKYNDLSQHHARDIIFDWDKILKLKGNASPYLQYTFARCKSVLEKASAKDTKKVKPLEIEAEERDILRVLNNLPEVIEEAAERFSPNLICHFAFEIAQKYNLFYGKYPIVEAGTDDKKQFRLALTAAVAQVLKNSLSLLGIDTPERM